MQIILQGLCNSFMATHQLKPCLFFKLSEPTGNNTKKSPYRHESHRQKIPIASIILSSACCTPWPWCCIALSPTTGTWQLPMYACWMKYSVMLEAPAEGLKMAEVSAPVPAASPLYFSFHQTAKHQLLQLSVGALRWVGCSALCLARCKTCCEDRQEVKVWLQGQLAAVSLALFTFFLPCPLIFNIFFSPRKATNWNMSSSQLLWLIPKATAFVSSFVSPFNLL